jgi:putative endonuclease
MKSNTHYRKDYGKQGETSVAKALCTQGFTILASNYATPLGEVDIVAQHKNLIVFVEVKVRSSRYFDLSTVITPSKQRKIICAAKHFMASYAYQHHDIAYRFDVALIEPNSLGTPTLTYLADAFRDHET